MLRLSAYSQLLPVGGRMFLRLSREEDRVAVLMATAWSGTLLLLVVSLAWLPLSPLTISNWQFFIQPLAGLAVTFAAGWYVARRARAGAVELKRLAGAATRAQDVAMTLAFMLIFMESALVFTYLAATTRFPLQDEILAAVDRAIGFDWLAFVGWLNQSPRLSKALSISYWSSVGQIWLIPALVAVLGRRERLAEFMFLLVVCSIAVFVVGLFFPAKGATAFHDPPAGMLTSFSPLSGMWHHETFAILRVTSEFNLDVLRPSGVVQFPSYHLVVALLLTYALRGIRWAFVPVGALNTMLIVATLPEGGHHLADLLGGALIVVVAILALRFSARGSKGRLGMLPRMVDAAEGRTA